MSLPPLNASDIADQIEALYFEAELALSSALAKYIKEGITPDPEARNKGLFCYPELILKYNPAEPPPPISRSFGKLSESGIYVSTITRPDYFRSYLLEQLELILADYAVEIEVRRSKTEIPYNYVWDREKANGLEQISPVELAKHFPTTNLHDVGDEVADGELFDPGDVRPLAPVSYTHLTLPTIQL